MLEEVPLVERHMGRLEVHSKGVDGEGTEFYVWLPLPDVPTV